MPCPEGLEKIVREQECEERIKIESAFCAAITYLEDLGQIEDFFNYAKNACGVDAEEAKKIHDKNDLRSAIYKCQGSLGYRQRELIFDAIISGEIKREDF